MQRTLAKVLTACYEPPVNVHGFVVGRSPVSNAFLHRRQQWVLRFDLLDFFPNINFGRVRGMFMAFPFEYPPDVATILAQLCCHENQLPQGAPTSPIISNYICRRLDAQLGQLARAERCFYTRYADDICFSTDRTSFPAALAAIEAGIAAVSSGLEALVTSNGFAVNPQKTRLMRRTQRQRVTGLVVNEKVNPPQSYTRSLRNLLYIWSRHGEGAAEESLRRAHGIENWPPGKQTPDFRNILRGRIQYVGSVKGWGDLTYRRLAYALQELDPSFQPSTLRILESTQVVRIFAEGKSDLLHLVAARRYFQERGEFTHLAFEIGNDADAGGEAALLAKCKALSVTHQQTPCVCVFDREMTPSCVRQLALPE